MSFNGSGVFNRLYTWVNDAAANIKIRADRMDNEMNGFATGLSTCITKDGQTTVTANLPMATYRHTGVGDGQSRTDYTSVGQTQDGKIHWVAAGGTADAITATYSIPVTALVDGQICYVRAGAANATTTPTFSPSSLTARTIVKSGGQALAAGDIYGDGHELILRYNLANTRWELLNPAVVAAAAVTDATISTSDVTTNNVSSTKHGWAPKSGADATTFLNGAATPAYAQVKDSDLSTSDVTTNNASTSKHGFLKKLSNAATDLMDGVGNWTNLGGVINALTTDSSPDVTADYIATYDASATTGKKVLLGTALGGGLTQIGSTQTPSGVATVVFNSIPQTYRALIVYWDGVSSDTTSRALQVQVDTNATFTSGLLVRATQVRGTTVSQVTSLELFTATTQTNAQQAFGAIIIWGYQNGAPAFYQGWSSDGTGVGDQTFSGIIGSITSINTSPIQSLKLLWNGSGNFDAGTIKMYGIS